MSNEQPYLSVVVTARNDDHGGNLLGRMQAFVNAWIGQAKRHRLSSELIVVDWNPPQDRPPLIEAIKWPADTGPCQVRFIQVPPEIHSTYQHPAALPLYQMIAKNVAMRRSRGRFILATNIDIIFTDELIHFFSEEKLLPGRMYRMDRHDVMPDVPVDGSVEEQLEYCATHIIRVCAREGYFELTPDGLRKLNPSDIAAQDSGIYFGDGWYSIEQYSPQEKFRWVDNDAHVVADLPSDPAPPLILDLEPGPGVGRQPFRLQVRDAADTVVAETVVAQRIRLELQLPGGSRRVRFRLHVPMGGAPKSDDPRIMNFRVFSCNWAERRSAETEVPKPRPEILAEARSEHEAYQLKAQPPERSLLKRSVRFYRDTGGPVSAARAAMLHHSRSRLLVRKAPLGRDLFDTANGIAPGAGWYELEHFRGETFRWAKDVESELIVSAPDEKAALLGIQIEPGPGVGSAAFELLVRDESGEIVARTLVERLRYTEIPLPCKPGCTRVFSLSAVGGGRPCPNGDPRILNFRVYWCGWAGTSKLQIPELPPAPPELRAPEVAAVRPPWRARVVSLEGDALEARPIDPAQIQRAGSNAAFLHTNTCGDFTLMAREHWFELRGYPEFDLYSFNIDSVLCYTAHHAGFREEMLSDPMRCYHIEHGLGSGWTPEGQEKLFERLRAKGLSWVDYPEVVQWIDQMRRFNSPMIFNLENWGLPGFELPERVVGCVESVQGRT
jgi:hypothetical protein